MKTTANFSKSVLMFVLRLALAAFVLNWVWELAQMYFYESGKAAWHEFAFCTIAAIGDSLLTVLAYAVGAAFSKNVQWALGGGRKAYLAFALFGAGSAVVIERIALTVGFWEYADRMPIIPLLDVGLIPVVQLTLLMPAALWLTIRTGKNRLSRQFYLKEN
jgi:hypothetical protein